MRYRTAAVLIAACLLGGCTETDWDHAFSYVGLDDSASAPPPTTTVDTAQAPPDTQDQWCVDVANSVQNEAAGQGFDAATQQKRAKVAYQQCMQAPKSP
jgi:hypothetical protein